MVLKILPVFVEKIWGGNNLKKLGYKFNSDKVGEAWIISGYEGNESKIENNELSLNEFYKKRKDLFNNYESDDFPLLVKILDAKKDLSIQVHPNDQEAKKLNNYKFGKSECWHILDCKEDTNIIIGHKAKNKEEIKRYFENKEWNKFIRRVPIEVGNSFNITPGTVHAICANTMLYELQQSSDITYRIYDYDRLENGKPRELHLKQSEEVIKFELENVVQKIKTIFSNEKFRRNILVDNKHFNLEKWEIDGNHSLSLPTKYNFLLLTNISEGIANINNTDLKLGESIILTSDELKDIKLNTSGKKESIILCGYPK